MFNNKDKEEIAKKLLYKIKEYDCPICHNHSFTIFEQYCIEQVRSFSEKGVSNAVVGIPFVMLICKNCGFYSKHNMFSLGLMDEAKIKGMTK